MSTRANLHIEDDALAVAKSYADSRGISLGLAVSELILRAEQAQEPSASSKLKIDKYGFLVVKAVGDPITPEMVKEALEDELD